MDHKILFVVTSMAVTGLAAALIVQDPNAVMAAVLVGGYATVMGIIVAGQSRHWRWAVAIFVVGLPAALVYALSRLRDADVAEPLSAVRG